MGPLVALDVVDVLVLEVEVGLEVVDWRLEEEVVVLVRVGEVDEADEVDELILEVVEVLEVVAAAPDVVEEDFDVVEELVVVLDVVAAAPEVVDESEDLVEDELAAIPFLYMFRRLGPPQYSVLSALQTMLHCVMAGVFPATKVDPAWIVLPQ